MSESKPDRERSYLKENEVLIEERERVVPQRREKAGFHSPCKNGDPDKVEGEIDCRKEDVSVKDNCVGLALSGGGVRSAAFSLGLLQAFHEYGLLRFVDFLSAVSGGTYAAAMLATAVPSNQKYDRKHFTLQQDANGKQPQAIREVGSRTNYLYRVDIFLSRSIPNFLLNLAPRVATVIAVGAGLAWLWRCLDFHSVRDHFNALGYANDYAPAFAWSVIIGLIWACTHIVGIVVQSNVLLRAATALMWATIAATAIGFAVIIGNGDVGLGSTSQSGNDGVLVQWMNNLWAPFAALIGIGFIPLLWPRTLMKSGVSPRGWYDSWIFYYSSLALFFGVPLVAVGWFARENISGFNTSRGPEVLSGDVKESRAFTLFAKGEFNDHTIYFKDLGIHANARVPTVKLPDGLAKLINVSDTATSSSKQSSPSTVTVSHEQLLAFLDTADEASDAIDRLLVFPADAARKNNSLDHSDASKPIPFDPQAEENKQTLDSWMQWRHLRLASVSLKEFGDYLVEMDWLYQLDNWEDSPQSKYGKLLQYRRMQRQAIRGLLQAFNRTMNEHMLFEFRAGEPEATEHYLTVSSSEIPSSLNEHLAVIAADIDRWKDMRSHEKKIPWLHPHPENYAAINRSLLEAAYPNIIRDRSEIRRTILIDYDQRYRLLWFAGSAVVALLLSYSIKPNDTGLHAYYRDRLAATYFPDAVDSTQSAHPAEATPSLASVSSNDQGLPYLLFNASTLKRSSWRIADQLEIPFDPFLLSPQYSGNEQLGYVPTSTLGDRTPTLADTMAISGAAINPAYFVQHFVWLMMNFLNLRTGQYVPNPMRAGTKPIRYSMLRDACEGFTQSPAEMSNVLLTDGGFVENLGVEELLKRRCRLVFVCDAGQDADHNFDDLAKVLRRMQTDHGIRISDFTPSSPPQGESKGETTGETKARIPAYLAAPIVSGELHECERRDALRALFSNPQSTRHFFAARILYPECGPATSSGRSEQEELEGILIYIKPSLTGNEGIRLCNFASRSDSFPHESTRDQSFSEAQFDAYRQLGFHAGGDVCREFQDPDLKSSTSTLWDWTSFDLDKLIHELVPQTSLPPTKADVKEEIIRDLEEFKTAGNQRRSELFTSLDSYGEKSGPAADRIVELLPEFDEVFLNPRKFANSWNESAVPSVLKILTEDRNTAAMDLAIDWLEILQSEGFCPIAVSDTLANCAIATKDGEVGWRLIGLLLNFVRSQPDQVVFLREQLQRIADQAKEPIRSYAADAIQLLKTPSADM